MVDVHGGMYFNNANLVAAFNNIVSGLVDHTQGWPININNAKAIYVGSNLYHDPQGPVRRDFNALAATDLINVDPRFTDAAAFDLTLAADSPAVNSANSAVSEAFADHVRSVFGTDIKRDIIGVTRPQGTAWDRGAYERAVTAAP
jgi:hypothetical protein